MPLSYLFEGISRQQIILSMINGLTQGVGYAIGLFIVIEVMWYFSKKFFKNQFDSGTSRIIEAIKRVKKK